MAGRYVRPTKSARRCPQVGQDVDESPDEDEEDGVDEDEVDEVEDELESLVLEPELPDGDELEVGRLSVR
jgi:hypothetical protein